MSLLGGPRRCLLVSRAEKAPQPDTPWLRGTLLAVERIVAAKEALVTGAERLAWDAALLKCRKMQGRSIVVLDKPPADPASPLFCDDFLTVYPLEPVEPQIRDRLIGLLADRAYAIQIRKNGNMAAVAAELAARGCSVESIPALPPAPIATTESAQAETKDPLPPPADWPWLTHYTRAPDGQWPGESPQDYLNWLCDGSSLPRDSFAALCRILSERRLAACGRLMPGNTPMVCFTELHPGFVAPLRRWRRGLRRWTFTRYGLAIRRETLIGLGARRVEYVTKDVLSAAAPEHSKYMQLERSGDYDWSAEKEWRIAGDVALSEIRTVDLLALVTSQAEKAILQQRFSISAVFA
ncbi:MAG TPA: hypothetical protein VEK08_12895 [Planctomycetota bacterium]|nr:hypothetical protein [Planctomycetota bacterium]